METIRGTVLKDGKITSRRFPKGTPATKIVEALSGEVVNLSEMPVDWNVSYSFDEGRVVYRSRGNLFSGPIDRSDKDSYLDADGNPIVNPTVNLACISCKMLPTICGQKHTDAYGGAEKHEACIGHVDNVRGLCCGHGIVEDAYLAFEEGESFYGEEALERLKEFNAKI